MKNVIRNNKISFIIISVCLLLIVFISSFVVIYDELVVDKFIYEYIGNFRNSYMDSFMINITRLGNTKFVMLFTLFMFISFFAVSKKKNIPLIFISSIVGISFLNQLIKSIFKRVRPDVDKLIEIGGYSFPSGHAMVSMVLYGLVAYIICKFVNKKWIKNIVLVISVLVILLIGVSRIYLGVHYFSDIIVGFLISIIFLVIIIGVLEKYIFSQN